MLRRGGGFTLIELLVSISIISVLMLLLIPAVNAARESARSTQCAVRLRNLALACLQFENTNGELPAWIRKHGVFQGGADRSDPDNFAGDVPRHVKVGGYGVSLLPWLEAQNSYEHWTDNSYPVIADRRGRHGATDRVGESMAGEGFHRLAAPNLPNFQCPSNPIADADGGRNSYISNNGMCHFRTIASSIVNGGVPGKVCSHVRSQRSGNGVFKSKYTGVASRRGNYGKGANLRSRDIRDGLSQTALFSENVQALPWYLPGFLNGSGPAPNLLVDGSDENLAYEKVNRSIPGELNSSQFTAGWVWHFEDPQAGILNAAGVTSPDGLNVANDRYPLHHINGNGRTASQGVFTLQMNYRNSPDLARPSSAHIDGVNVGFADASTRFISESIDYRVYQAMLTPRGKSSDVPWPEFVAAGKLRPTE